VTAVDDCSLQVAKARSPRSSDQRLGKTTLFNFVTGYLPADAGVVRFAGRRFDRPDPARLVSQRPARTFSRRACSQASR